MKEKRIIRYRDKIDFIVSSMESIPEKLKGDLEISGAFYRLHTSIEAAMDLVAMVLKDTGKKIDDDYTNIESLKESGIITEELSVKLKECNGLRNYLVHRYDKVDGQSPTAKARQTV
ncbi:MAG TPA: DUF86 domain-containing protein [Euryarchaeota archaeon]|nr:hypothetical protein BMS3Bbin15_01355 [archaeon BMS3Bbin15]HDL15737.1 DUF86 domain-containing protein [Euryarchaeota archaeon]